VRAEEAPERFNEYTKRVSAGLRAATLVVAPSAPMLSELESDYGPLSATRVIPNGRAFEPPADVALEPFVLTAGRLWDEAKNVNALCAAARDVSWPVFIAGDERYEGSTCAVPSHVWHLGRLGADGMRDWLARASIYVLPARYEPFGLSVLEAALAGCALVLGDIRSLRENWNGAALFVAPDDHRALAVAIQALIDDGAVRGRLAALARERASSFNVDRMADAYLSIYSSVRVPA
jgi:glycogen synthase